MSTERTLQPLAITSGRHFTTQLNEDMRELQKDPASRSWRRRHWAALARSSIACAWVWTSRSPGLGARANMVEPGILNRTRDAGTRVARAQSPPLLENYAVCHFPEVRNPRSTLISPPPFSPLHARVHMLLKPPSMCREMFLQQANVRLYSVYKFCPGRGNRMSRSHSAHIMATGLVRLGVCVRV